MSESNNTPPVLPEHKSGKMPLLLISVAVGLTFISVLVGLMWVFVGNPSSNSTATSTATSKLVTMPVATQASGSPSPVQTSTAQPSVNLPVTAVGTPGTVNPYNAPITPVPTPAVSVRADSVPAMEYAGAREFKLSDQFTRDILTTLSESQDMLGVFNGEKINFYVTSDAIDKVEEYYRKFLEANGWAPFERYSDLGATMLIYQKSASKLLVRIDQIDSTEDLLPEFQSNLKQGDNLIMISLGNAIVVPPTPLVIPGSPVAEVKSGQKKIATIELEKGGTIQAELYPDIAPVTVENFEKLAGNGFYNGLSFHRIVPGFVVQGGDPNGDGTGGPGYQIPGEFMTNSGFSVSDALITKTLHYYGSLAMARSSDPNSAGSQFYIVIGQESDPSILGLNGKYAVFGKVYQGMDLVEKIAKGDKIKSIKVEVK